jgi:DNA primase
MIDQATIDRITDAANIVDVVGEFVTLKRRGVNFLGCCPFHNEKTPSFTVSPGKQIFKCFGCGKGGNSVNFIMEHEHLNYVEALKYLAKKYHIEVADREETPQEIENRNRRESLMIVSGWAQTYYSNYLFNENDGRTIGLGYFRERGFRDDIIKKFQLGFCPDHKDTFTQAALKQGYKMEYLEETGLTIKRDDWIRDRFSGRVIFPFHNLAGRVIAFGGRILKTDPKVAKYLNSPESEIYHKSKVLYGIYLAKNAISKFDKCYLVEGYTDVLSFHQSGIENVVASSGTSLTVDQIRLIKRFTPNVTIIYDGDQAGLKASFRGIDMVLEEGINVKVVPLPDGEDPDSFARSMSATALTEYIEQNETDFIRFKTKILLSETENDPVARARLIGDIVRSISVIPDNITRTVYIRECSTLLEVSENIIYQEVNKLQHKAVDDTARREMQQLQQRNYPPPPIPGNPATPVAPVVQAPAIVKNPCEIEELALLRILLRFAKHDLFQIENPETHKPEIISVGRYILNEMAVDDLTSSDPVIRRVFEEMDQHIDEALFDIERYFGRHPDIQIGQLVSGLLVDKHPESAIWRKKGSAYESEEEVLPIIVPRLVEEYKLRNVKILMAELMSEMKSLSADNIERVMEIQTIITNLKQVERALSNSLGKRAVSV